MKRLVASYEKYDGERICRTDMVTHQFGKRRIVYESIDGRLFFKYGNHLHGVFLESCYDSETYLPCISS